MIEKALAKRHGDGVRRLFAVSMHSKNPLTLFPEPAAESEEVTKEVIAIWAACSPWTLVAKKSDGFVSAGMRVEERDPAHRIVVKPVIDDSSRMVGIVGMVIDEAHLRSEVLPKAIQSALPQSGDGGKLAVWVCDERWNTVLGEEPGCGPKSATRVPLSFAFTNWTIALPTAAPRPEAWARRNFAFNLATSAALAAVLLVAVVLALRAAAREVRLGAMKSDFVSNVSHELRTPLASIRVFGELMRSGGSPRPTRSASTASTSRTRAAGSPSSSRTSSTSRASSRGARCTASPRPTSRRSCAAPWRASACASSRPASPSTSTCRRPAAAGRVDAGAVDHAICNLLDNALKYSGDLAPGGGAAAAGRRRGGHRGRRPRHRHPAHRAGPHLRPLLPGQHRRRARGARRRARPRDRPPHRRGARRHGRGRERARQGQHLLDPAAARRRRRRARRP